MKQEKRSSYETAKIKAAIALRRINPRKPLGTELFDAVAPLCVNVALEAVCLRRNPKTKILEIFLTLRRATETAYPNLWHIPGSILRPGEEFKDVFLRLAKKECIGNLKPKTFLGHFQNTKEPRGHFLSIAYLCTTNGTGGTWYPIHALPKNTFKIHRAQIIPVAVKAFKNQH